MMYVEKQIVSKRTSQENTMQTLKKFIKYYKPYKAVFFIDLLCATIISAIDLAFPQLLRTLTKTLFAGAPGKIISALIPITIGLLVAYIIQTACRYYVTYAGHMMGARMERDMRKELFDQYEKLSFSYYDQNNSGQMMSKLVSDLFDISELAHHGPENLFISLIKIIGSFIFLFMINRMLAVPMLILVVLMLHMARIRKCRKPLWITGEKSVILIRVFRILWRA